MQQYTDHEARADAPLAFLDHIPPGGTVEAQMPVRLEDEGRFQVEVKVTYPNGSWKAGTVYLSHNRMYALCIHTEYKPNGWSGFPHSWNHGVLV